MITVHLFLLGFVIGSLILSTGAAWCWARNTNRGFAHPVDTMAVVLLIVGGALAFGALIAGFLVGIGAV